MSVKIMIGADIVPTKSNEDFFIRGNMQEIVDVRLMELLAQADYRIMNLEVPLTDQCTPIVKYGPALIADSKSAVGLKNLGIDFVTLANNHIMDQGIQGLESTIRALKRENIAYSGAGSNLEEARLPYIVNIGEQRIGIYCCAEHEFSISQDNIPGANPFDALDSLDHIAELRSKCDYVIVLYHGGKELYQYPSPYLQKVCRKIIDKGADLVVCQHSHCIGCEEKWGGHGTIVYGQGNFLFDHSKENLWKTSLLIEATFDGGRIQTTYYPICKKGNGVELPNQVDGKQILDEFRMRSLQIKDESFVAERYKAFSISMLNGYLVGSDLLCSCLFVRILNRLSGRHLYPFLARKKAKRMREKLINVYQCEAHRELIIAGLEAFEG